MRHEPADDEISRKELLLAIVLILASAAGLVYILIR